MTPIVFYEKPGCSGNARQHTDTGARLVGFDTAVVDAWVGLGTKPALVSTLEGCASPTERCATSD